MDLINNLYLLPYSNEYYFDAIKMDILNTKFEIIPVINNKVKINWYDGVKEYDIRIIKFIFKSDYIPPLDVIKEYSVIEYRKSYAVWFKKPLESKTKPGYYHIPSFPRYLISRDGEVHDVLTNNNIKHVTRYSSKLNVKNIKGGYSIVKLFIRRNIDVSVGIHRLLLLVFNYPLDENPDGLYSNHIDGNPSNNSLNNLEWVTPRENLIHALKNNLMPNSVTGIQYKNLYTGEIRDFSSIAEAKRSLNLDLSFCGIRARGNQPHKRYFDGHLFKLASFKEWPELEKEFTYTTSVGGYIGTDTNTNKMYYAKTSLGMSRITNVNPCSISDMCKGRIKKPVKGYKFSYLKDYKGQIDINTLIKEKD